MANPENKIEKDIQSEIPKENKMGVMPVGKLLFTMSLPIMISMLVQALYNVVDSMFVARVSENALTALSIAFPIQNLMIAVSVGLGVGLNAVVSRALGAKDTKGVNRAATNGIMLMFICGLIFMLGGATLVRPYFEMPRSGRWTRCAEWGSWRWRWGPDGPDAAWRASGTWSGRHPRPFPVRCRHGRSGR